MQLKKWILLAKISVIVLFIGIFLAPTFLFWIPFLGLLGVAFLLFACVGIALVRRRVSLARRTNPEAVEALFPQRIEAKQKEKTVGIKDLPIWLITLIIAAVLVSYMGWMGAFRFNALVEGLLSAFVILSLIYYFLYKHRIENRK